MLHDRGTAFLQSPRLGMFSVVEGTGWARPVPVWFSWEEGTVELFSGATSPKVAGLRAEPRAHLLATNHVGEPEAWVSLTGPVELHPVDAAWLAALAGRYWDLTTPTLRAQLDGWLAHLDALVGVTMRPAEVRSYGL